MSGPLSIYLDALFKQSAYHESYLFRGFYFCGRSGLEEISEPKLFLSDVFKKFFSESSLAQPVSSIARSRNRTVLVAQVLTLLIVLVGGGGLAVTYFGIAQEERELHQLLAQEVRDLKAIQTYYYNTESDKTTNEARLKEELLLHSSETRLFEAVASMNARKFGSPFIPSSWFSGINERLEDSIATVFQYVIFESLRLDMQRRANRLLSGHPDHSRDAYLEESAASATHLTHDFQLSLYVEELGEFRVNLERYNRLVGNDGESFNNLRHLVLYLDHTPLPAGFDKKGVTFYYLNNIIETEALLRRTEYAWLATSTFGHHSPFHGMTLSAALGELRKSLQDLRREDFMSQNPAEMATKRHK